MSSIASFFIIEVTRLEALRKAAQQPVGVDPQRPSLLGSKSADWRDPLAQFLHDDARELDRFAWSGSVMVAVEQYLRSLNVDLFGSADQELSNFLSSARGGSWIVIFRHDGAYALAQILTGLATTSLAINTYIDHGDDLPDDFPENGIREGLATLKYWLSQIQVSQAGLLSVG